MNKLLNALENYAYEAYDDIEEAIGYVDFLKGEWKGDNLDKIRFDSAIEYLQSAYRKARIIEDTVARLNKSLREIEDGLDES